MSFSVPTSPAISRSGKANPVTPQRLPRQQPRSQSLYRSPLTPSTSPYSPLSLRSMDSTDSSILTTPDNSSLNIRKRLIYPSMSVDHGRTGSASKDKSFADIADNWRSRANENGIKVSFNKHVDPKVHADNSADISCDLGNTTGNISGEDILAAPFISNHRRLNSLPVTNRPRAVSHASFHAAKPQPNSPLVSRSMNNASASPQQRRTSASAHLSQNILSTPPPNRALSRQLKLKGSLTDPPQPRRREAFGALPIPSQNAGGRNASMNLALDANTSLDLFDISEDDFEYEAESFTNSSFLATSGPDRRQSAYPNFSNHDDQSGYPAHALLSDPFQQSFGGPMAFPGPPGLPSIAESHEHPMHFNSRHLPQNMYFDDVRGSREYYAPLPNQYASRPQMGYATFLPIPAAPPMAYNLSAPQPTLFSLPVQPIAKTPVPTERNILRPTDCSVCLAPSPSNLAVLEPCLHPLCSACLTSALNIVGEKDMECSVCKKSVAAFKLLPTPSKTDGSVMQSEAPVPTPSAADVSFARSLEAGVASSAMDELQSAFDFNLDFGVVRASTPKLEQSRSLSFTNASQANNSGSLRPDDHAVLRIDNVPWDITPLQISTWLQQPVEMVYVLLDPKGKTLSHAYVEVKNATIAGAILRGEASSVNGSRKERGSVLGRGRRARGVTVTRSSQAELMKDLFPSWTGGFEGSRPSLAGLGEERILGALDSGLMKENEINGLLRLIREPDSHFLKVPVLPFHSLISLLVKFPCDADSRVFWSTGVRDALFDATHTAIQLLVPRVEKGRSANPPDEEHTPTLLSNLAKAALGCKVFTSTQLQRLKDLAESHSLVLPAAPENAEATDLFAASPSASSGQRTPEGAPRELSPQPTSPPVDTTPWDELAKEFGVGADLIQAVAQRIVKRP